MQFKRIDMTTEQRIKSRKRYLVAGKIKTRLLSRSFSKTFQIDQPTRIVPDLSQDTVMIVKHKGQILSAITATEVSGGHFGLIISEPGKYVMEVKHAS